MTTKRHAVAQGLPLLDGLAPAYLIADCGYNSDPLVAALAARGICAVIPPRRKRRHPQAYDAAHYAQRHGVERLFSRLKQFGAWPPSMLNSMPIFSPSFIWRQPQARLALAYLH